MAVYLTEVVTDLAMPPQQRPIPHQFAMGDNNAYTITALLCDSRNPEAELLDGTVGGELVRPDGVTVALAGEKGDAVRQVNLAAGGLCNATPCSVTLPQACFAVPGRVTLTIKLTEGTTITQALSVSAVVVRTSTDEAVDPGEVIPDLAAIQAAAADALEAAADATEAAEAASTAMAGSVRFDQAQTLTDAQKLQARNNIGAGTGRGDGAVRYDEAQTLTDAQKTTARGNIEAASLIPSGTAFSQAVQGGTTYDVQDSAAVHYTAQTLTDAQKEQARVNAGVVNARGMVNYGYDTPGSGTAGTSDATRIAYTRVGTLLTLNGTSTSIWRLRISGTTIRMAATPPTSVTAVHTVLNPAHDYRFVLRLISGTCTRDDDGLLLYLTPYNASTQTQLALRESWQDDSGNYYRMIPASTIPSDGKVSFLLSTGSGTTFTNAVFEAVLEDVTERTGETGDLYTALEYGGRNLAPSDTATAASTHTAGSLLTVGGTLYKATQAIAPGTVITPGTNVTETTVAAQLAALEARIAALEG